MQAIYDLKETLCKELEEYGEKGKLDLGGLDIVDKLAHTIKNLDRIIMTYEEEGEYSSRGSSYNDGMGGSYRGSSRNGGSYARGRSGRRDSMGRFNNGYSSREDIADRIRNMMEDAPDERTRQEMQRLASRMEQM